ncbi:MAG: amidohydrolase family protein [Saprospiraceae bacterium]|nr:amidohydrolase family protein [Saprospiraceae bacterium]
MIRLLISIISISALTSCSQNLRQAFGIPYHNILIYNANIIDVNDGQILPDRAILISKGMIKTIGSYSDLKSDISKEFQFDAHNKYVIPGLWDMHVHIEGEDLIEDNIALFPVYIAYGITTVRDMASDLGEQVLAWRDEINERKLLGPRIYTAGRKLEGLNSIWKRDLEISNVQELHQMLDTLEKYKVDLVKITENTLEGPLFLKSVVEAKKRGFKVSGHVPHDLTIRELVDAGFSSIEHASYLLRLGMDEKKVVEQIKAKKITKLIADDIYLNNFNQDTAIKAYNELAKTNIAVTPTLIGGKQLAYLDEDNHKGDVFLDYLTKRFTDKYQWRIDRMANYSVEKKQQAKDRYQLISQQLPFLQKAGITILAGSDAAALNTFVYPALALHEELILFQKSGLTPLQTLQSATKNGAKFMGKYDTSASVEKGKMADMVVLNTNPLEDIKSTQDIFAVIKNGRYFSRSDLDKMLETAKNKKVQLDIERNETKD